MIFAKEISDFLDKELEVSRFVGDESNNGLQVDAPYADVEKVCFGVDASLDFFKEAKSRGASMCVVHHGISWGSSLKRIVGVNYELVSFLTKNDMALYGVHLPLDSHKEYGNNATLARELGVSELEGFGAYHGYNIGFSGVLAEEMSFEDLCVKVRTLPHKGDFKALGFGKERVRSIGIVSGGGAYALNEAYERGIDVLLTGEMNLQSYNECKHMGLNMIAAGHYATECGGVKNLSVLVGNKFGIKTEFIDLSIPF